MTPMRPTALLLGVLGAAAETTYPYTYTNCGVTHTISAAPTKAVVRRRTIRLRRAHAISRRADDAGGVRQKAAHA